ISRYGGAPASCGLCGGGGPLFTFNGPATGGPTSEPSVIENSRIEKTVRKAVVSTGNTVLRHNVFENTPGLEFTGSGSPEIDSNTVRDCGESPGIAQIAGESPATVRIHDNTVERCGGTSKAAIEVSGTKLNSQTAGHNTIRESPNRPITFSGNLPFDVTNQLLFDNGVDEVFIWGSISQSATWESHAVVHAEGTISIPAGVTLTIQPGVYVRTPNFNVKGTILAQGSAQRPIVFTGVRESEGGEWGGITLEAGSGGSSFNYVEFAFGGSKKAMLTAVGVSPTVTNSTFRRSSTDAIKVQNSGKPTIESTRFRKNTFGLRYEGEGKLSAPHNDWGCPNGPKPLGCGDPVTSNVEWKPIAVLQELPRLCPGTDMTAVSDRCLLDKYEPTLSFDSEENYLADDVAGIAENWGDGFGLWSDVGTESYSNRLFDKDYETGEANGKLIGESQPGGEGEYQLTIGLLGALYPNSLPADSNDWLDENDNYLVDAHRLESEGFVNSAYGSATTDSSGKRWLQYWYWYYYNPASVKGFGKHEGDWESVLIGLDSNNRPDEVVLSQHTGGASCTPEELEETPEGAPIVYVAVGSHANYPRPGTYQAPFITDSDHADGNGMAARPGLVPLEGVLPSWIAWPGHWGNTQADIGLIESTSPEGPAFHDAWGAPDDYAAAAEECEHGFESEESAARSTAEAASAPSIETVTFEGRKPRVAYRVPQADGDGFWPRLRLTVDELNDGGVAASSVTFSGVDARGKKALPFAVKPGHEARILGSLFYEDGRRVHLAPRRVQAPINR
ncbi:MAG: DUF946 domain-containing protein, partial [Actinobacteria bacterium]